MKQVTIYTDGACSVNPGPGGFEVLPTAFVARGRRNESLKGRNANRNQEIFFNPASTSEELHIQIDKFIAAPPAGFSYPRGTAKA